MNRMAGHTGCTYLSVQYTACSALDATYETLPTSDTDALNQTSTTGYTSTAVGGFGLWPTSDIDFNGQTTTYTYDALGRMTSTTLPGETAGLSTKSWSYTVWCAATGPQAPCVEIDETQRLDATTTVVSRAFYDGLGRLVETRRPGPAGQDVVAYAWYDESGDLYKESNSYFVPAYTGAAGSAAFAAPDVTQPGTIKTRDVIDRVLTVTDPASNVTTMSYAAACNILTGDTGCYEQTTVVDALGHQRVSSNDALGRQAYDQRFTGNSTATYALYATTTYKYDANGNLIQITHPDGTTTTSFSFDAAGRKIGLTDPDRGTEAYTYDQNGNLIQASDARGAAGTVYAAYDGLDRLLWRNTSNTSVGARVAYAYDGAAGGSTGIGKLTSETFTGGAGSTLSGTYRYSFDTRGRSTRSTTTLGGAGVCPTGWTCADIGTTGIAGSQSYVGDGVWTVQGAGGDIWGTSDQFHFMSQPQAGDGSVSAQIAGQSPANTSTWAKAGVMLRLSSDPGSPYYAVEVTPGNGISVQDRTTQGGSAAIVASTSGRAPAYVQVTRTGTSFTAYTSSDGSTWTAITGSTVSIPALTGTLLAGIAVTAHNTGALSTVTVGSVSPAPAVPASVSSYSVSKSYDDAGNTLSQTYPTGEVVNTTFTGQGWLGQVTTTQGTTTTTLASNITYTGFGGAAGNITGMQLGNGVYTYAATYDFSQRLTSSGITRASDGTLLLQTQPGYDAVGNVTSELTTLPAGTDNQAFCYDEQDRLTWAGATGTPPCGATLTPGSLTAAQYTAAYSYDTLGRLTSSPTGSYTYAAAAHLHAATAIGASWTAAYDPAGNMTCRAPTSTSTCAGASPTGQQLTFDAEGMLTAWQNAPTSPTSTASYLYDGDGTRVVQQVTTGGATTTTTYIGNVEEVATSGASTTTTTYYYAGQLRVALAVNGTFSYLGDDVLDSATGALDAAGAVTASQLYGPYGSVRYSNGTMPGSFGFTGQRADTATGLDYYGARYYDPAAAQFISADTILPGGGFDAWGLSRYAYVEGNPLIRVDPTGHDGWLSGIASAVSSTVHNVASAVAPVVQAVAPAAVQVLDATTGIPSMINDVHTIFFDDKASGMDKLLAAGDLLLNVAMDASMVVGVGEGLRTAYVGAKVAEHVAVEAGEHVVEHAGEDAVAHVAEHEAEDTAEHAAESCALSFSADTLVATPGGEVPIATLTVGETVVAYDPATGTSSAQTVEATSIHHDANLLDVTLHVIPILSKVL